MSELPSRVRRAFSDHGSFEPADGADYESTTTAFTGLVEATERDDGRVAFEVTVRVPMLDAVTRSEVAEIVENGWFETFELRVSDVGGIAKGDPEYEPELRREGGEIVVEASLADLDERRGVDDAGAFIDFVEGTYVQGIIPGYDYTEPVASLLSNARTQGNSDGL